MISVIVPVYNVEPYLRECLDSLIGQTYKDLELILVDDGSTDASGQICDDYALKDPRIKVTHISKLGTGAARNIGLTMATGELIGFTDADDWCEPQMYERLAEYLNEYGADVCSCDYIREPSGWRCKVSPSVLNITGLEALALVFEDRLPPFMWDKLYRRELWDDVRFPEGHNFEDVCTIYEILVRSHKVVTCPERLYHYRRRKGSIVSVHSMDNIRDCWEAHIDRYNRMLNEPLCKDEPELMEEALRKAVFSISKNWRYVYSMRREDRDYEALSSAAAFVREHSSPFGRKGWGFRLRIGAFLCRHVNAASFFTSFTVCRFYDLVTAGR